MEKKTGIAAGTHAWDTTRPQNAFDAFILWQDRRKLVEDKEMKVEKRENSTLLIPNERQKVARSRSQKKLLNMPMRWSVV